MVCLLSPSKAAALSPQKRPQDGSIFRDILSRGRPPGSSSNLSRNHCSSVSQKRVCQWTEHRKTYRIRLVSLLWATHTGHQCRIWILPRSCLVRHTFHTTQCLARTHHPSQPTGVCLRSRTYSHPVLTRRTPTGPRRGTSQETTSTSQSAPVGNSIHDLNTRRVSPSHARAKTSCGRGQACPGLVPRLAGIVSRTHKSPSTSGVGLGQRRGPYRSK